MANSLRELLQKQKAASKVSQTAQAVPASNDKRRQNSETKPEANSVEIAGPRSGRGIPQPPGKLIFGARVKATSNTSKINTPGAHSNSGNSSSPLNAAADVSSIETGTSAAVENSPAFEIPKLTSEINHPIQPDSFEETAAVETMRRALDMLAANINDREVVAAATKQVLTDIKEHSFLRKYLLPEDLGLMVRGLREGYQVTLQVKETRTKKQQEVNALAGDLSKVIGNFQF